MLSLVVLTSLLLVGVSASTIKARDGYAVKETHSVPRQWSRVGPAPGYHFEITDWVETREFCGIGETFV